MSTSYTNINKYVSKRDITYTIWKRILNNLPYIYKTKGTKRSIRALITCYGIPQTLLKIKEYGGPDTDDNVYTENKFENYSYALKFFGSESIQFGWHTSSLGNYPSAIELRYIGTSSDAYITNNSMSLLESPNSWSLGLVHTTGSDGYIKFILNIGGSYVSASTNSIPIFDNKPTSIVLQRSTASDSAIAQTYNIYGKKYIYGAINYEASGSVSITSGQNVAWNVDNNLYIGGNEQYGTFISGSIDEFRLWDQVLLESTIDNHVKFPQSILGNQTTGSFDDLILRFTFDNPRNHFSGSTSLIENSAPLNTYDISTITFNSWPNDDTFPYSYKLYTYESEAHYINLSSNRVISKVFTNVSTSLSGNLNPFYSVEKSQYETPNLSSNLIGIYFSPADVINEDIIKSLNISSIGDILGDPADYYSGSYSDLKILRDLYWNLSTAKLTFTEYIDFINKYDNSLFKNIRQLLPARSNTILGISYEPTILERNKVKHNKPQFSNDTINQNIPLFVSKSVSTQYNVFNADINTTESIQLINEHIFDKSNIYSSISINSNFAATGSYINQITPIVDFDTNVNTDLINSLKWNSINTYNSSSGYNPKHYIRHEEFGTWEKRLKFVGCLQTRLTTTDGKDPVEISYSDNKQLLVKNIRNTKLQVE